MRATKQLFTLFLINLASATQLTAMHQASASGAATKQQIAQDLTVATQATQKAVAKNIDMGGVTPDHILAQHLVENHFDQDAQKSEIQTYAEQIGKEKKQQLQEIQKYLPQKQSTNLTVLFLRSLGDTAQNLKKEAQRRPQTVAGTTPNERQKNFAREIYTRTFTALMNTIGVEPKQPLTQMGKKLEFCHRGLKGLIDPQQVVAQGRDIKELIRTYIHEPLEQLQYTLEDDTLVQFRSAKEDDFDALKGENKELYNMALALVEETEGYIGPLTEIRNPRLIDGSGYARPTSTLIWQLIQKVRCPETSKEDRENIIQTLEQIAHNGQTMWDKIITIVDNKNHDAYDGTTFGPTTYSHDFKKKLEKVHQKYKTKREKIAAIYDEMFQELIDQFSSYVFDTPEAKRKRKELRQESGELKADLASVFEKEQFKSALTKPDKITAIDRTQLINQMVEQNKTAIEEKLELYALHKAPDANDPKSFEPTKNNPHNWSPLVKDWQERIEGKGEAVKNFAENYARYVSKTGNVKDAYEAFQTKYVQRFGQG